VESKPPRFRHIRGGVFWVLCGAALALIVAPAAAVIVSVLVKAAPVLRWSLFTNTTQNLQNPGLQNGILGTLVLSLGVVVVAGPIGILGGIYLSEFAPRRLGGPLRFFSEVLAGVPSIVIGLVAYTALVVGLHWGFSILSAIIALSLLTLPYIVKTTEVSFGQVPRSLREASTALGLSRITTIRKVLLPPALPGVISGMVIALAISTGETAPLLYTASFSQSNPTPGLFHNPIGYLTYITYYYVQLPGSQDQALASAAAGITILMVLLLIFAGRAITARQRRLMARLDV
jgi:phosphate transport system permease protein